MPGQPNIAPKPVEPIPLSEKDRAYIAELKRLEAEVERRKRELGVVGGISRCGESATEAEALKGDLAALRAVAAYRAPPAPKDEGS